MATIQEAPEGEITAVMESLKFTSTITDLKANTALWYRVHVFVYDLRNFRGIPAAQKRLGSIVDASYTACLTSSQTK